ncbi:PLAT domain-containing protein 3-like [Salvia miltiorrhiza]|uniref:PLAT domain-containing protein 3-like n=1 Tax=Salvia miltiorrhiza TaxID=226208 RepID=UPI0025AC69E1|nr:PLAT domain-containing protein 3-like [Salvia miltiorrhiza]
MEIKRLSFNLLILFSFIIYTNANAWDCVYSIYVETGNVPSGGTSSNITIFLSDNSKAQLPIVNLKDWGLMGPTHDYFGHGEVDLFAGKGPCLPGPVCSLIIVLDGYDSWYCDFINVTTVGVAQSCSQKHFVVKKWLDVNKGSAVILQDECSDDDDDDDDDSLKKQV